MNARALFVFFTKFFFVGDSLRTIVANKIRENSNAVQATHTPLANMMSSNAENNANTTDDIHNAGDVADAWGSNG